MKQRYRVIETGSNADEMEKAFNQLFEEGYVFKAFVDNFGTRPAGAKAIAVFELIAGSVFGPA